jgi:hypothetical protein
MTTLRSVNFLGEDGSDLKIAAHDESGWPVEIAIKDDDTGDTLAVVVTCKETLTMIETLISILEDQEEDA